MKSKVWLIIFIVLILSIGLLAEDAAQTEETGKKVADATPLFLWSIIIGGAAITVAAVFGAFAQSKACITNSEASPSLEKSYNTCKSSIQVEEFE